MAWQSIDLCFLAADIATMIFFFFDIRATDVSIQILLNTPQIYKLATDYCVCVCVLFLMSGENKIGLGHMRDCVIFR
jgi:hypothetical protein